MYRKASNFRGPLGETKPLKPAETLLLIAVLLVSFVAGQARAARQTFAGAPISGILSNDGTPGDLSELFDGVQVAAKAVSVSSSLGDGSFIEVHIPPGQAKKIAPLILAAGLTPGDAKDIFIGRVWTGGPLSASPIPETRTLLLYALGVMAVGRSVVRARRSEQLAASRAR